MNDNDRKGILLKSQILAFVFKLTVQFKNQTRYRVVEDEETQLDLASGCPTSSQKKLQFEEEAVIVLSQPVQLVCSLFLAALIHERVAKGLPSQPWISMTCTDFISTYP